MAAEGARFEAPLRFAVVELTNRCNLRCPHCASGSGAAREDELDAEAWAAVFTELKALGCEEVTLLGGEIFLRPDWLEIARAVVDLGLKITVVTNGLLLKGEVADQLASLPLERLGVSLDGASNEVYQAVRGVKNGFDRVWSFIQSWRERGSAPVSAITTFSQANLADLDNLADLLTGVGVTWQVQIAGRVSTRFHESSFLTREQFRHLCRRLGELARERAGALELVMMDDLGYFPLDPAEAELFDWWSGCEAGRSVVGLRANGDILGCLSLGDAFVEANLRRRSLAEIWRDPESFSKMRSRERHLAGACATCPESTRCRAGCAAMAFSATGDIAENPYCLRRLDCEALIGEMDL